MNAEPSLVVPKGWRLSRRPAPGVDLVVTAPDLSPSGFRARATLVGFECALSLRELQQEQVAQARSALHRPDVEDVDIHDLGDVDAAYLRVLHRVGAIEVITEAWTWISNDTAWTLTASVDHTDYATYCDVFDGLAASFDPAA